MAENPYSAPRAHVEDRAPAGPKTFLTQPRSVPAANGWSWIRDGFALFRQHPVAWIVLLILMVVVMAGIALIFRTMGEYGHAAGGFIVQVVAPGLAAGIMLGCRGIEDGRGLRLGSLFAGFSTRGARLVALGVAGLAAMVLVAYVAGTAFGVDVGVLLGIRPPPDLSTDPQLAVRFMLAGLVTLALSVPVYMAIWFAPALIALNDFPLGASLRASFVACARNILPFLVYGVALLLLGIVAVIPVGLGMLVWVPLLFASLYASYRDLFYER